MVQSGLLYSEEMQVRKILNICMDHCASQYALQSSSPNSIRDKAEGESRRKTTSDEKIQDMGLHHSSL